MNKTDEFQKLEKGRNFLRGKNFYDDTNKCFRFYDGDQWNGLKSGAIEPVMYNIIKPIVKYKVGVLTSSNHSITFNPNNYDNEELQHELKQLCEDLNEYMATIWERQKLDNICRRIVKDSCITGEGVMYINYVDGEIKPELIDKTNIYYSNENDSDIENQDYIIITQRRSLESIKQEARDNGVSEEQLDLITADEKTEEQAGDESRKELDNMVESLTYFYKENGTVHFKKCVENLVYKEATDTGLRVYPVAHLVWEEVKGSARGVGDVIYNIPNQIEINKTLLRRALSIKQTAYPKMVYNRSKIANPEHLTKVGAAIMIKDNNTIDNIASVVNYLQPMSMSSDANVLQDELVQNTQELAGAGDAVTGTVDPTKASGRAILALQEQAQQNITEQKLRFYDFLEDVAKIAYEHWRAFPEVNQDGQYGKTIITKSEKQLVETDKVINADTGVVEVVDTPQGEPEEMYESKFIPEEMLQKLEVSIKIDVSPNTAFDKYAKEASLEQLLQSKIITFEEYVEALPADSTMPKTTLQEILKRREETEDHIADLELKQEQENMQIEQELEAAGFPKPVETMEMEQQAIE